MRRPLEDLPSPQQPRRTAPRRRRRCRCSPLLRAPWKMLARLAAATSYRCTRTAARLADWRRRQTSKRPKGPRAARPSSLAPPCRRHCRVKRRNPPSLRRLAKRPHQFSFRQARLLPMPRPVSLHPTCWRRHCAMRRCFVRCWARCPRPQAAGGSSNQLAVIR